MTRRSTYGPSVVFYMKLPSNGRFSWTKSTPSSTLESKTSKSFCHQFNRQLVCTEELRTLLKLQFKKWFKWNLPKDRLPAMSTPNFNYSALLLSTMKRRLSRSILNQRLDCEVASLLSRLLTSVIRGPAGDIKSFFIIPKVEHGSNENADCLSKASLDAMAEAECHEANRRLTKITARITKTFKLSGHMVNRYGSDRRPQVITYCPPCLHLIESAFEFHTLLNTADYRVTIRVDFSLPCSCCPHHKLGEKLSMFHDAIYKHRTFTGKPYSSCFENVDTAWIRQRILELHIDSDESSFIESCFAAEHDNNRCAAIIFFSEPTLFAALAAKFQHMGKPWQEDEVYWLIDRAIQEKGLCVTRREMGYFSRI